jgi:hypothetical protein
LLPQDNHQGELDAKLSVEEVLHGMKEYFHARRGGEKALAKVALDAEELRSRELRLRSLVEAKFGPWLDSLGEKQRARMMERQLQEVARMLESTVDELSKFASDRSQQFLTAPLDVESTLLHITPHLLGSSPSTSLAALLTSHSHCIQPLNVDRLHASAQECARYIHWLNVLKSTLHKAHAQTASLSTGHQQKIFSSFCEVRI